MVDDFGMNTGAYYAKLDGAVYVNAILSAPPKYRPKLALAYFEYTFRGIEPTGLPTSLLGFWNNLKQSADWILQGIATGGTGGTPKPKPKGECAGASSESAPDSFAAYSDEIRERMIKTGQYPELTQGT